MTLGVRVSELVENTTNPLLKIHSSWSRVPLNYIAEVINGFAYPSSNFNNSKGVPLLRIRDIGNNTTECFFDGPYDELYVVEPDDLVIGMDGDFNCARWKGPKALLNQRVCKINLGSKLYNPKLLDFVLPGYLQAINDKTSSVTVKHLSSNSIAEIPLPLPPLQEQMRIAIKIEELFTILDAGVQQLHKVEAQLKVYRRSVLIAAVTGKLTEQWRQEHRKEIEPASMLLEKIKKSTNKQFPPPNTKELPLLPDKWIWTTFEQISKRVTVGHVGPMKHEYVSNGIPFLRSQNVRENYFDPNGLKYITKDFHQKLLKSSLHPGDVVVVRSGDVGVACVIPEYLKEANCSDLVIVKQPIGMNPHLCTFYMNSLAKSFVSSKKVGVALTHFNTKSMAHMPIPLPPLLEQEIIFNEVERRLSSADKVKKIIDKSISESQKLRQSILKRAFEGKLVTQDPTDEPATVLLERIKVEKEKMKTTGKKKSKGELKQQRLITYAK